MKKAVIFGVTGQDGSYLTSLLLSKHYEVYGVSRRGSTDNLVRLVNYIGRPDFHYATGDVTDFISMINHIRAIGPDEVYNLAAQSHVHVSFEQPSYTWEVVAKGPLNILEAIRLTCPTARYYQASSSEMFGQSYSSAMEIGSEQGLSNHILYQDENTPMLPCSPYAIAKLAGYHTTRMYRQAYGIHASNGILFNHESELRGNTFVSRKITQYIAKLYRARSYGYSYPKLKLGNLRAYRDWGHAEDYVYAMWLMLQQAKPDDYVVATGEAHTVEDFVREAFACVKITNYMEHSQSDSSLLRPNEVPFLKGDPAKAKAVLGWEPKVSFCDLVRRMVKYDVSQEGLCIR